MVFTIMLIVIVIVVVAAACIVVASSTRACACACALCELYSAYRIVRYPLSLCLLKQKPITCTSFTILQVYLSSHHDISHKAGHCEQHLSLLCLLVFMSSHMLEIC
jgi:hypothetical protein